MIAMTVRAQVTSTQMPCRLWCRRIQPQAGLGCFIRASSSATSTVALALLAKGYHIVLPPISGAGAVRKEWDDVYSRMVDNGFSKKVVMEGTGAKAGESYAWAIANPDKVSVIYARNPLMRSLMFTKPLIDNLVPLARAGVPVLHDCGSLDPWLKSQTREVEKHYKALGGKITVLVTNGEGHFPVSRKYPKPVVDFILSRRA